MAVDGLKFSQSPKNRLNFGPSMTSFKLLRQALPKLNSKPPSPPCRIRHSEVSSYSHTHTTRTTSPKSPFLFLCTRHWQAVESQDSSVVLLGKKLAAATDQQKFPTFPFNSSCLFDFCCWAGTTVDGSKFSQSSLNRPNFHPSMGSFRVLRQALPKSTFKIFFKDFKSKTGVNTKVPP